MRPRALPPQRRGHAEPAQRRQIAEVCGLTTALIVDAEDFGGGTPGALPPLHVAPEPATTALHVHAIEEPVARRRPAVHPVGILGLRHLRHVSHRAVASDLERLPTGATARATQRSSRPGARRPRPSPGSTPASACQRRPTRRSACAPVSRPAASDSDRGDRSRKPEPTRRGAVLAAARQLELAASHAEVPCRDATRPTRPGWAARSTRPGRPTARNAGPSSCRRCPPARAGPRRCRAATACRPGRGSTRGIHADRVARRRSASTRTHPGSSGRPAQPVAGRAPRSPPAARRRPPRSCAPLRATHESHSPGTGSYATRRA